ncbi:MAG: ATP synthase subunit I [Deltaproteobacteria bacterium]|nr:ATP synthase subunit I [Deltaproteobacteria bacterium]MBW2661192.1 ATP synthase subunit I [Deltaproteobacteria bacterium]
MNIQQRIFKFVVRTNWVFFCIASVVGLIKINTAPDFARGIILGGLIVTINFHLLYRSLKKAFMLPNLSPLRSILAKYYVRFFASAFIIFVLISRHYVDPIGLILGLSVVVASIILATMFEFKNLIFKEAL